jgi:hypothetical protein
MKIRFLSQKDVIFCIKTSYKGIMIEKYKIKVEMKSFICKILY